MAAPEKLTLHLAPEAAGALREAVAAGEYATAEAAAEAAVRQWAEQRALFGFTREELGALSRAGLDSGPSRLASMDEVKAEARRRLGRG